jgi:hypothetical protein
MTPRDRAAAIEALLKQPASAPAVRAAAASGELEELLDVPPAPGSADAIARLEAAAGDDAASHWLVKLALLVAAVPPGDTYDVLAEAGFVAEVKRVADILLGAAALASLEADEDVELFVEHHRANLPGVLLFAYAQSGSATDAMWSVADAAGLDGQLSAWVHRADATAASEE